MAKYIKTEEGYKTIEEIEGHKTIEEIDAYDLVLCLDLGLETLTSTDVHDNLCFSFYATDTDKWSIEKGDFINILRMLSRNEAPKILLKIHHMVNRDDGNSFIQITSYAEPFNIHAEGGGIICPVFLIELVHNLSNFKQSRIGYIKVHGFTGHNAISSIDTLII
jgi:hypothetical protein